MYKDRGFGGSIGVGIKLSGLNGFWGRFVELVLKVQENLKGFVVRGKVFLFDYRGQYLFVNVAGLS